MTTWASFDHGFDSIGGVSARTGIDSGFPGGEIEFSKIDPGSLRRCLGIIRSCPELLLMILDAF